RVLIKESCQFERQYLAWETVRQGGNPFFENGTGFEGYFIGCCHAPSEALTQLLSLGHQILTNISRLHRFEYQFQSRLHKTLMGELEDLRAMSEWSDEFGATLARLRCKVLCNKDAQRFQSATKQIVDRLPPITYINSDN